MLRALFKLVLLVAIVVGVAGYMLGWWSGRDVLPDGTPRIDTERARQIGAQVGEKTAAVASKVADEAKEVLGDGALTTKIKAKMALDDTVKARDLNVDTANGVVTVKGTVRSNAERDRALQLARETDGVRQVLDRITVEIGK
jgi:osmotically-inducible protein OsmY